VSARLILVEGMIGAGKSTTARQVASWLVGRGEDARVFSEFAADHPIRTKAIDRLRAVHPEPVSKPDDVGQDGLAADPRVYEIDQWRRLAERCRDRRQTVVLESTLLQNSVLPAFVNGAPADIVPDDFWRVGWRSPGRGFSWPASKRESLLSHVKRWERETQREMSKRYQWAGHPTPRTRPHPQRPTTTRPRACA
jgi:hypothetical protein